MRSKKAQGLSMQTIVLAVLALFVLIVLMFIFGAKARTTSDFYNECSDLNGTAVDKTADCPDGKPISTPFIKDDNQKCCVKKVI